MGNSSGVPANDPLLQANNRQQSLLNSIYTSNASVMPGFGEGDNHDGTVSVEINPPKVKKTKTYKNPILLKRDTIKLEQDSINHNIYYITFEYDSLLDFIVKIHFNAIKNSNQNIPENFLSGPNFSDIYNSEGVKAHKALKLRFSDSLVVIDVTNFMKNKQEIKGSSDLIIELIALKENLTQECVLATFCKVIEERVDNKIIYKVKVDSQKLNVRGTWFEMHDVYGLTSENNSNECEICCTNKKNTIFLPCKHSYACNSCAYNLRKRNNPCPICRTPINDLLIIENDDSKKTPQEEKKESSENASIVSNTINMNMTNTNNTNYIHNSQEIGSSNSNSNNVKDIHNNA